MDRSVARKRSVAGNQSIPQPVRMSMKRRDLFTGRFASSGEAVRLQARQQGLSEGEARDLTDRILAMSEADETAVSVQAGWSGNTRFAVNRVTTAGESTDVAASITARVGRREASASTNRFDDDSLRDAVSEAERLARLAPEDPEMMPLLEPQEYAESDAYHEATAELSADLRAEVAAGAIGLSRSEDDLVAAGFLSCNAGSGTLANSAGLFAHHPGTSASYSLTVRTRDGTGSGWAGGGHRDWGEVDAEALNRRAVLKAAMSREPRTLEPGVYRAVLEPEAVSDLVGLLAGSLSARSADEGRSAFSTAGGGTKIGERIVDSRVTLRSDPQALGGSPFDGDGMPLGHVTWVEGGVLQNLSYSRFWAAENGVEPTGPPGSLRMAGGNDSLEELIAGVDRGVLLTRFWYIRQVDPRTILYTGLTRDGTFLIENGEIAYPVNNFRWNDSPLFVLSNLEAMSRPVRVSASREFPALRTSEFTLSSVSEAV